MWPDLAGGFLYIRFVWIGLSSKAAMIKNSIPINIYAVFEKIFSHKLLEVSPPPGLTNLSCGKQDTIRLNKSDKLIPIHTKQ